MRNYPKVSFIIPTLNAAWILPKCLQAIRSQDYPQEKVEIVIADGGSTDKTLEIAKKYKAIVIKNPEVLHEPGKARASEKASGEILFFTDADNILVGKHWIELMVKPYLENKNVKGFLPQTQPPPDSSSMNRYLGYLFTDPFTWFVYGSAANPKDYENMYIPLEKTKDYLLYKFPKENPPLFGLSQGVGTVRSFKRGKMGWNDDLLSGIKLIQEGGMIAYVPKAGVYHYHVDSLHNFMSKYRWRIRNNFQQQIKGMGYVNRNKYFPIVRKLKAYLFIIYALTLLFPFIDSFILFLKYKDIVMFWHIILCFCLSVLIIDEKIQFIFSKNHSLGWYR